MQAGNAIQQRKKGFSEIINQQNFRSMIERSIGNPQRAAAFVSTLISVVRNNEKLKDCDPNSIVAAALRGEVGMGLSVALGEYAIVPYGKQAQFQLQVNGLKRIAVRSGKYAKINFFDVREGEYKGRDRMTREPIFEWIEDDDEREKLPIIGYYGYYILSGTYNGFSQTIYWTHDKILKHADRYAKAFELSKYRKIMNHEFDRDFTEADAKKLQTPGGGSPWYANPNELPHMKMCMKTIAKQLLGDGLAPKEVVDIIEEDNLQERSGEPVYYAGNEYTMPVQEEENESELPVVESEIVDEPEKNTLKAKKGSEPKVTSSKEPEPVPTVDASAAEDEYDPMESFFR